MSVTHIAAQDVTVDDRLLRQLCAWCGAILVDYDLARVAVPVGQDARPGTWPVGVLVTVDGPLSYVVDGDHLPLDTCAREGLS